MGAPATGTVNEVTDRANRAWLRAGNRKSSAAMQPPHQGKGTEKPVKRRCHRCHGSGRVPCAICRGSGQVVKGVDMRGRQILDRCGGCFGLKTSRCPTCGGEGFA
jgi:DnaJ-class molecular chaperone